MGTVCVEIAVRDDPRLLAALGSLSAQTRRPDRVLIAASPATPAELADAVLHRFPDLAVELIRYPGGPVDARALSLRALREDTTAFLDSDEVAPPEWLARLVRPIEEGRAAFSGGPTRPIRPPATSIERYYDLLERSIYEELVPKNIAYLPLQNTAWATKVLVEFGFDPLVTAEDHDLENRVLRAGHAGVFLPEAWVYHDKSIETSYWKWARKRYLYLFQMAMSILKNRELGSRLREHRTPLRHPLRYVESAMKPLAFVHAWVRWSRVRPKSDPAPPSGPPPGSRNPGDRSG